MEINAYQPCPCHAERKIKFCCGKQIVGDLNEVMALNRAGQTVAGLDKLDRLLKTWGEKDCLLTLQTHMLLEIGETAKARETNERFLLKNPRHPMGLLHRSLIAISERDLRGATYALQDAMDGIKGNAVPISIAGAYRTLGVAWSHAGKPFASRAHLRFANTLRPDDQHTADLLYQAERLAWESVLLGYDPEWPDAPKEPLWLRTYQQVRRLVVRGQWRTAMQYLERKMLSEHPDEPVLRRAVAVLATWLGDDAKAIAAWRSYAQAPGLSLEAAVEAYGWIMSLEPAHATRRFDRVKHSVPIRDLPRLLSTLRANPRTPEVGSPEGLTPRPLAMFDYLDRPLVTTSEGIGYADLPFGLSNLLVFGEDDESPRLQFLWIDDPDRHGQFDALREILGDAVDIGRLRTEVLGPVPEDRVVLNWAWHLPPGLKRSQLLEFERAMGMQVACERWTRIPMVLLDDKSPRDVADDPQYRAPLLALISQFETGGQPHRYHLATADAVRQNLGLPPLPAIDPRERDAVQIAPIWLRHVDWPLVKDGDLVRLLYLSAHTRFDAVAEQVARETLRREHLADKVPFDQVQKLLSKVVADDEEALDWMRRVRKLALAKGSSPGPALVDELELRLARGVHDKIDELIDEIHRRHMNEPGVAARMAQLTAAIGELKEEAETDVAPFDVAAAPLETSEMVESIVTVRGEGTEPRGKLWLPGDP